MKRLILVSGACGSGKTDLGSHMAKTPADALGPTARIELDYLYTMTDPGFDAAWPEPAETLWDLARSNGARLARAFFDGGIETVVVLSNALHIRERLSCFETLGEDVEVHHVTLDPSLRTLVERMARRGDQDKTPEWLAAHLDYMRPHYADWTMLIDNSDMTVAETIDALVAVVTSGASRLAVPRSS